MLIPRHLVGLYNRTVRRYKKVATRLEREKNHNTYRYITLLERLRKLRRKILNLQAQLKLGIATGAIVVGLSLNSEAQVTHSGPFNYQPRHLNPLREPYKFMDVTYPAFADIDKDGDLDMVVADQSGVDYYGTTMAPMRYFRNIGTQNAPVYEEKFGAENPFSEITFANDHRGPVFADIDNDGDVDLFMSLSPVWQGYNYNEGRIAYFRNDNGTFVEQTAAWNQTNKVGNPFFGVTRSSHQKLAFGDIDKDGDLDAIITGEVLDPLTGAPEAYVTYYKNNGQGTFTRSDADLTFTPAIEISPLNPAIADVDGDGDLDIVFGGYYLGSEWDEFPGLMYYKQTSPGNFVRETAEFNATTKTGNPFYEIYFPNTQPVFADLDNDGDADLLVGSGDGDHYYWFPRNVVHYYENKGNSLFEERRDLENPVGGVDVRRWATPTFIDIDSDGDMDAVIGHKYNDYYADLNTPFYYERQGNQFVRKSTNHPLASIEIGGFMSPEFGDVDGDGDMDAIFGTTFGEIAYFRNNNGAYQEQINGSPFQDLTFGFHTTPKLADMDGDGDLDLIVGTRYSDEISYYENIGTPQAPEFIRRFSDDNPFQYPWDEYFGQGQIEIADIDHDGDLDLIVSAYLKYEDTDAAVLYENVGSRTSPQFQISSNQPFLEAAVLQGFKGYTLKVTLVDHDQDGDLDLFAGDYFGHIKYLKNDNPAVVTTVASSPVNYVVGIDDEILVDPLITLTDQDDDLIVRATVTITNYEEGDELHVVDHAVIKGTFDASTGVLTLRGKAPRAEYQSTLRTITYHKHPPEGGRTSPRKKTSSPKPIEYLVYDTDNTQPLVATRVVNVIANSPPEVSSTTESTQVGSSVSVNLLGLLSDPDGNLDLSTLQIIEQPTSGAEAFITTNHELVVDYGGLAFRGTDYLTIEVCDELGECAQNVIAIEVGDFGVEVFNFVAPNSTGDNKYVRIRNLPQPNKVTIYNRWGDKIFEVNNYDNSLPEKRFEGRTDGGKDVASGTYFYRIEIGNAPDYTGPKEITGFITLKQ